MSGLIYNKQCACINHLEGVESDKCLKRYLCPYDYKSDQNIKIAVCNEYFRLKMTEPDEMKHICYIGCAYGIVVSSSKVARS